MNYDHVQFTGPQLRALAALSGEWLIRPTRSISPAIDSLSLYHPNLVEARWDFGPRGGWERRVRLTPAGLEAKKARSL